MALTKVAGDILDPGLNIAGVVTATKFVGPFDGTTGSFSGDVSIDGSLTVQGDQTTLNTTLRNVELLRVAANSATTAGIITQTGAGDILNLFDATTEVVSVIDGGNVGIGITNPGTPLEIKGTVATLLRLDSSNAQGTSFRIRNSGTDKMYMGLAADFVTGQSGNVTDSAIRASGALLFASGGGTERVRIDSAGKVGIGTDTPSEIFHIRKNDTTGPTITLQNSANKTYINNWGSNGPSGRQNRFEINATATTSLAFGAQYIAFATGGIGDSNERLRITGNQLEKRGGGSYFAYNPNGYYAKQDNYDNNGGKSYWYDGGSGNNNIVASIDGQTGNIQSKGNFIVSTATGQGIDFSATSDNSGMVSELLDDYEEGSFTMFFWCSNTNFSTNPTMTANNCRYTKIGNQVSFTAYIAWGNQAAGGSGNLYLGGLPYAVNNYQAYGGVYFGWHNIGGGYSAHEYPTGYINNNSTNIVLMRQAIGAGGGRTYASLNCSAIHGTTGTYSINGTYLTNS